MGITSHVVQFNFINIAENAERAAKEFKKQLEGRNPAQIIYFAAGNYDPVRLASAMKEEFPDAVTIGCSTSGEIVDGGIRKRSVAAMAFDADVFELFEVAVVQRTDADGKPNNPARQVEEAFAAFAEKLGRPMAELEYDKYLGIALADGRNYYVEPVLDRIGDLTPAPFIGAAAGDDGKFAYTPLFCNGRMYTDAVALAITKPRGRFALVKSQGLELQDRTFVVTGADEEKRLVTHLDGRPAATVYCEAIGVSAEEGMDLFGMLDRWPLSLMAGEEPYIRVVTEALPDQSLRFLHSVKEGMRLKLGRSTDVVDSMRVSMEKVKEELGSISAVLHFNCLSRLYILEQQGKSREFADLFAGYPSAGFFSHGEFYIAIAGITSTMLVFA